MSDPHALYGWTIGIDASPEWIFVRIDSQADAIATPAVAQCVWDAVEQHQAVRLVVEIDHRVTVSSHLIGQLVLLHKRVHRSGGVLRLCDLSVTAQQVLKVMQLADRFPNYATREDAVLGRRPGL